MAFGPVGRPLWPTIQPLGSDYSGVSVHSDIAASLWRPFPLTWGRLTQALWHARSVRGQLLIVFVAIEVVAAVIAGAVIIHKARTATQLEVSANMDLAELLVSEAVNLMQQETPAERFLAELASQLRVVRHVRIGVEDAAGRSLVVRQVPTPAPRTGDDRSTLGAWIASLFEAPAPAWFEAVIAAPVAARQLPVIVNGQPIGKVEIAGEPRDEIGEYWENTSTLAAVTTLVNLAAIGILYVLFGRVLEPLTGLSAGLGQLERRRYQVRLPRPAPPELAAITDQFNALAQALDVARAENLRLSTRLVTAQDDERRRTALDLHDEVGPSLFGLKANANSIATAAGKLDNGTGAGIKERVADILAIVDQLQVTNRSILDRLRPMALGHVPLQDLLSELVRDRQRASPQIAFSFAGEKLDRSYGEPIDLTIYRCIQESLTNAIRHAQAKHVVVTLSATRDPESTGEAQAAQLELTVRDDGLGIDPGRPQGHGTTGMQERVHALGGRYRVESETGRGTSVRIAIPLRRGSATADRDDAPDGMQ
jgi:two-component system, NarL family, sensor histidine kinase UhpB